MTPAATATEGASGSGGDERGLRADLAEAVGRANFHADADVVSAYTTDWTGRYSGEAAAVVLPGDVAQVCAVLEAVRRHGAAVVPQGGNTGLVGGSVPRQRGEDARPQVVLATRRLDGVEDVDTASRLLVGGGGATLASAQAAAGRAGWHLGVDLSARDSATLGGMAATNAGGMQVLRYGQMRARVAGIEAVLADGSVVSHLGRPSKDNVGWDPAALLVGSEGTLGVVTRVALRMERLPSERVTALVAVADAAAALAILATIRDQVPELEAAELTLAGGMQLVVSELGLRSPPGLAAGAGAFLTLEAAGSHDTTAELATALDRPGLGAVVDAAVASDSKARASLWAYRERHTEAVSRLGIPHKLDISVVPGRLPDLLAALPERVGAAAPGARLVVWGHAADGNLHVNVVGPPPDDDTVDDAVLRLALELGGSISAEHGIGVARRKWLRLARPDADLELMARVKAALDPYAILNPGVLEPWP